jgi:hypothetical protein
MSVAALAGGIGAAAAQAQNEVLSGTATTIWGGANGLCFGYQPAAATVAFNAAGSAVQSGQAGPTSQFTETNATVSARRPSKTLSLMLSIPFTIVSGSTKINGAITNPSPYAGGHFTCFTGSFYIGGIGVNTNGAAYTATIQRPGQPAQTVSGTAEIDGGFQFEPYGVPHYSPITETLLNFPAP